MYDTADTSRPATGQPSPPFAGPSSDRPGDAQRHANAPETPPIPRTEPRPALAVTGLDFLRGTAITCPPSARLHTGRSNPTRGRAHPQSEEWWGCLHISYNQGVDMTAVPTRYFCYAS